MPKTRTPVRIDPEQCKAYLLAKAQRDQALAAMASHRAAIEAAMGEMTELQTGPFQVRRASHMRDHLDQTTLKRENPGMAAQYTSKREVYTFTITLDPTAVLID